MASRVRHYALALRHANLCNVTAQGMPYYQYLLVKKECVKNIMNSLEQLSYNEGIVLLLHSFWNAKFVSFKPFKGDWSAVIAKAKEIPELTVMRYFLERQFFYISE